MWCNYRSWSKARLAVSIMNGSIVRFDTLSRLHVFEDLRPYLCTYEECEDSNKNYPSWSDFIDHEIWAHECGNKADCVFCGEVLPASRTGRGRHIGRHMEEIAFTVVTKPYKAWDFYSDSASDQSPSSAGGTI